MDPHATITPIIDENTRNMLVPAGVTGIVYLILSGQMLTFRTGLGAILASLTCGYFGALATARILHLQADSYSLLGAAWGFVGHMALMGVIKLGESWRADPQRFLARFFPFIRRP